MAETPPTNVRAVLADGSAVPLVMVYSGLGDTDCHVWTATAPLPSGTRSIQCDTLPARTSLSFPTVAVDPRVLALLDP